MIGLTKKYIGKKKTRNEARENMTPEEKLYCPGKSDITILTTHTK